jgi:hypothetical protein
MTPSANKQPAHIFIKSMFGVATIISLGFIILNRGQKQKHDFDSITARIISIGRNFPGGFNRNEGKIRYVQVGNYPKVFELFIGHDTGDFSPAYEQVDALKAGDIVTVYYDEENTRSADNETVNRLAQFIDKDGKPYFIRGNKDKYGGYGAIGMGVLIGLMLLILKKKGTIE